MPSFYFLPFWSKSPFLNKDWKSLHIFKCWTSVLFSLFWFHDPDGWKPLFLKCVVLFIYLFFLTASGLWNSRFLVVQMNPECRQPYSLSVSRRGCQVQDGRLVNLWIKRSSKPPQWLRSLLWSQAQPGVLYPPCPLLEISLHSPLRDRETSSDALTIEVLPLNHTISPAPRMAHRPLALFVHDAMVVTNTGISQTRLIRGHFGSESSLKDGWKKKNTLHPVSWTEAWVIHQVERNDEMCLTSSVSVGLALPSLSELSYISETQLFPHLIYILDEMWNEPNARGAAQRH